MKSTEFSASLQQKVDLLKARAWQVELGSVKFDSPLLLAPMASICNAPFRLLMENLGAGGTVSELVSCHGIIHGNEKTMKMLHIDKREKNVGIQLFGEEPEAMATAAEKAQEFEPGFIDINMGCPVRKVVTKGGGSALMQDPSKLGKYFSAIKNAINIPLTIKIRTGWDEESINADEVIHIANEEGIEFVAVHGRTRAQQYKGKAKWEYLEHLAGISPLPLIGNGDLHSFKLVQDRLAVTKCDALMLARGPLRNPFIFLESFIKADEDISFTPNDYWEIISKLYQYMHEYTDRERHLLIQMRKHIVWFAAGFPGAAVYRQKIFTCDSLADTMKITEDYFLSHGVAQGKFINPEEAFMTSGHG